MIPYSQLLARLGIVRRPRRRHEDTTRQHEKAFGPDVVNHPVGRDMGLGLYAAVDKAGIARLVEWAPLQNSRDPLVLAGAPHDVAAYVAAANVQWSLVDATMAEDPRALRRAYAEALFARGVGWSQPRTAIAASFETLMAEILDMDPGRGDFRSEPTLIRMIEERPRGGRNGTGTPRERAAVLAGLFA